VSDIAIREEFLAGGFFQVVEGVVDGGGQIGEVMAAVGEVRNIGGVGDFSQRKLAGRQGPIILRGGDDTRLWFMAADDCENDGG